MICIDARARDWIFGRFPAQNREEFRFAKRAAVGSDILHSISYSQKTASIMKYLDKTSDSGENYGEILIFFSICGDLFLLVKKFHSLFPTNIFQVDEPENDLLLSLYEDRLYGSFYHEVARTDQFDVVLISDILCSAVLIETADSLFLTDVLPFEHD